MESITTTRMVKKLSLQQSLFIQELTQILQRKQARMGLFNHLKLSMKMTRQSLMRKNKVNSLEGRRNNKRNWKIDRRNWMKEIQEEMYTTALSIIKMEVE